MVPLPCLFCADYFSPDDPNTLTISNGYPIWTDLLSETHPLTELIIHGLNLDRRYENGRASQHYFAGFNIPISLHDFLDVVSKLLVGKGANVMVR